jgi:hypothetical protein
VLEFTGQEARTRPAVASNNPYNASPRLMAVCGFTDLWTSVNALKRLHAVLSLNAECAGCLHCWRTYGI